MLRALSRGSSGRRRSECGSSSRARWCQGQQQHGPSWQSKLVSPRLQTKGSKGISWEARRFPSIYAMGQRSKSVLESGSRVSGRQGNLGVGKVESRRLRKWDRRRSSLVQLVKLRHDRGVCGGRDTVDRSGQGGEDGERPRSWQEQRKGDSAQALGSRTPETMTALLASPRSDSSKFVLSELP